MELGLGSNLRGRLSSQVQMTVESAQKEMIGMHYYLEKSLNKISFLKTSY